MGLDGLVGRWSRDRQERLCRAWVGVGGKDLSRSPLELGLAETSSRGAGCGRQVHAGPHDLQGPGLLCWCSEQTSFVNSRRQHRPPTPRFS